MIPKNIQNKVFATLYRKLDKNLGIRATPTCVGKSFLKGDRMKMLQGHPHVCGEESESPSVAVVSSGTPPRVWGRVFEDETSAWVPRDTPTCVGKRYPRGILYCLR